MTKKIRNWLFVCFIGLFIIGTTVISLYASGFKANLSWPLQFNRLLIRTGMIIVESQPNDAIVFIDNEPQTFFSLNPWHDEYITTTAKIRNVPPGEYTVRLERTGYWPWEKKVTVYPNQATTLLDVYLFKSNPPELLTETATTELSLSETGRYLYVTETEKIISTKNSQEAQLPSGSKKYGVWRNNSNEFLYNSQLFNSDGLIVKDFRPLLGDGTINHFAEETDRLYYQKDSNIGYLDLSSQSATLVLSATNILSYQPRKDKLWLVSSDNGRALLQSFVLPAGPLQSELELPGIGTYTFKDDNNSLLSLYDNQNKTLYLINPESPSLKPITVKDVLSWQWVDDNTLLYNNKWEIFRLNIDSGTTSLLTRVGEEINALVWNNRLDYLIFSTANSLQAFDPKLETITRIFQAKSVSTPILDADDNVLYFWADTGETAGVWRSQLQ